MQLKIEEIVNKKWFCLQLPRNLSATENLPLVINKQTFYQTNLLQNIQAISGIDSCLFINNLVAVKYASAEEKEIIKALVMAELDDFLQEPSNFINESNLASSADTIENITDTFIRPTLNKDNGDIVIHSFENGVLKIQFTGHCAGCPYARNTLNNVIVKTLQKYIPQVKNVILQE